MTADNKIEQSLKKIDLEYGMVGFGNDEDEYVPTMVDKLAIQVKQVNLILKGRKEQDKRKKRELFVQDTIARGLEAENAHYQIGWFLWDYWAIAKIKLESAVVAYENLLPHISKDEEKLKEQVDDRLYSIKQLLNEINLLLPKIAAYGEEFLYTDEKKGASPEIPPFFGKGDSDIEIDDTPFASRAPYQINERKKSPHSSASQITLLDLYTKDKDSFIEMCCNNENYASIAFGTPEITLSPTEQIRIAGNHKKFKEWMEGRIEMRSNQDIMNLKDLIKEAKTLTPFRKILPRLISKTDSDTLFHFAMSSKNAALLVAHICLTEHNFPFVYPQWRSFIAKIPNMHKKLLENLSKLTFLIPNISPKQALQKMRDGTLTSFQVFLLCQQHDTESVLFKHISTPAWVSVFQACTNKYSLKKMLKSRLPQKLFEAKHLLDIARKNTLAIRYILDEQLFPQNTSYYVQNLTKPKNRAVLLEIATILVTERRQEGLKFLMRNPAVAKTLGANFWRGLINEESQNPNLPQLKKFLTGNNILAENEFAVRAPEEEKEAETGAINMSDISGFEENASRFFARRPKPVNANPSEVHIWSSKMDAKRR